jgi:6-phosphogluconolactonase (cycloisomerase 2 family)
MKSNRTLPKVFLILNSSFLILRPLLLVLLSLTLIFGLASCPPTSTPESVVAPSFDPPPNSYNRDQAVSLLCATQGASIHYTTDGTEPSASSPVFTAPITVGGDGVTTKIRAIAIKEGLIDSSLAQGSFTIDYDAVAAPAFDPYPTQYNADTAVTLTCATPGAAIRYTLDGTDPTTTSPLYTSPIAVSGNGSNVKIKAYAFLAGMSDSGIAQGSYSIRYDAVATPEFIMVQPGKYSSAQSIYLSCATPGATLRYTTDASDPSPVNGTLYTGTPISVASTTMLRVIAYKTGFADSGILSGGFIITGIVATPAFTTLTPGFHFGKLAPVTLSCATPGSVIRYTTDGTNPVTNGITYTGPIDVPAGTTTVKAYAFAPGWIDSGQAVGDFEMCNEVMYVATLSGNTSAFYLHADSGQLTELPGSPYTAGLGSYDIKVHPNGKYLYIANQSSNTISAFSINQVNGSLMEVSGSPFATGTSPGKMAIFPTGEYLYVPNIVSNNIICYSIDQNTGALSSFGGPTTAGPNSIGIAPSGVYAYATSGTSNTITGFSINQTTGILSPFSDPPVSSGVSPFSALVNPKGTFLYACLVTGTQIWSYKINQSDGHLGSVGITAPGPSPFALATNSRGTHLYAVGLNTLAAYNLTNSNTFYPLDGSPYAITSLEKAIVINNADTILYIGGSGGIRGYRIDLDTGVPSIIIGSTKSLASVQSVAIALIR